MPAKEVPAIDPESKDTLAAFGASLTQLEPRSPPKRPGKLRCQAGLLHRTPRSFETFGVILFQLHQTCLRARALRQL